jgi:hypothetical protein
MDEEKVADYKLWLAFVYNCRGDLTDLVWSKFREFCEREGLHLLNPEWEEMP